MPVFNKIFRKNDTGKENIADIFGFGGEKSGLVCYIILIEYWIELGNLNNSGVKKGLCIRSEHTLAMLFGKQTSAAKPGFPGGSTAYAITAE